MTSTRPFLDGATPRRGDSFYAATGDPPPAYTALPVAGIDAPLQRVPVRAATGPFVAPTRLAVAPPAASALPLSARPALPPPPANPQALIDAAAWDADPTTALAALNAHVDSRHGDLVGQEDLLFGLAQDSPHESVRVAATESLGDITSVRAVDLLLVLYWSSDDAVGAAAEFRLSPGAVQSLNHASCKDAPTDIDRCLGDLVLFAPADGLVPDDALLVLRSRFDTSRDSVCAALRTIAARSPDPFASQAREALQEAGARL